MFGVLGALTGARRGPAGTIVWCRFTKVIQGVISNTQSVMMAVIVRSNMCRGFPQAVRMDYSGLDVGGGLVGRAAGREPAEIATTLRNMPGPACVMRAQRDGIHTTLRHASSARRNPPQLDPCRPTSHNASPADTTKTTPRGRGASWKAAASRTAGMTTPPRRGSPARSSSAGWPRPAPRGGAHRRMAHRIPGRAPTPPGQTRRRTVRPARPTRPDPVSSRPRGRGVPL